MVRASDRGAGSALKMLAAFVGMSVVAGVCAAGLALPAVAGVGQVAKGSLKVFEGLPAELQVEPPSQRSTILYADGSPMATFFYENRIAVPLAEMSPKLQSAILAIEDARFFEHKGVDPWGIVRAGFSNALGNSKQGASTLTQQWVKNVLLGQAVDLDDKEQIKKLRGADHSRKIKEIKYAIAAEKSMTKHDILQNYLNIAPFGASVYGAEAASRMYFSKSARELTLPEAALLAGAVQSPYSYDPIRHPEAAQERRNVVLARMRDLNFITQKEYDAAIATPIDQMMKIDRTPNGCVQAGNAGMFCDYVTKVIENDPVFGAEREDRVRLLQRGGLTITTTLDRRMQDAAHEEIIAKVDPARSSENLAASMVSVQPGTGKILAMAQNRLFGVGKMDKTRTALNHNATFPYGGNRGRPAGSNMKAFVLAQWLKEGRSSKDVVNGSPRTFSDGEFMRCGVPYRGGGQGWSPRNAGGGGMMTVEEATYRSVNGAYATMETQTDLCKVRETAESLGMFRASPAEKGQRSGNWGDRPYQLEAVPSMVLGQDDVAPLNMAGAYAAFANKGVFCRPIAIAKMTDRAGKEVPIPNAGCNQALPEHVGVEIASVMQNVYKGTMARVGGLDRPSAGKTGTTTTNSDTWYTGYTPDIATSAWVGRITNRDNLGGSAKRGAAVFNGETLGTVYGATVAGAMWKKYMLRAHEGMPVRDFPTVPVPGVDPNAPVEAVPNVYGKTVEEATAILTAAGFQVKVGPDIRSKAPAGRVAGTSPRSGTPTPKGSMITLYISGDGRPEAVEDEVEGDTAPETPVAPAPAKPKPGATAGPASPGATAKPAPTASAKPKPGDLPPPAQPKP